MITNQPSPQDTTVPKHVPTPNLISPCCRAQVVEGMEHDATPLGHGEYNGFGLYYAVDICDSCGMKVEEPIEVTECCGEETCSCIEDELEKLRVASI